MSNKSGNRQSGSVPAVPGARVCLAAFIPQDRRLAGIPTASQWKSLVRGERGKETAPSGLETARQNVRCPFHQFVAELMILLASLPEDCSVKENCFDMRVTRASNAHG